MNKKRLKKKLNFLEFEVSDLQNRLDEIERKKHIKQTQKAQFIKTFMLILLIAAVASYMYDVFTIR